MPPQVRPEEGRIIRIEDVDRGVRNWFDRTVDAKVEVPNGERRKVPVRFASGERWVASADRQGIRDKDGRLILPIIQIRRTDLDPVKNRLSFGVNVPRLQISRLVSEKTSDIANADQNRSIATRRLRDGAVYDVYTIPFPSSNNLEYTVKIQVQYQTQMNEIIERILARLQFFNIPSFIVDLEDQDKPTGITQGEGSSEVIPEAHSLYELRSPLSGYYVVGYIEGNVRDEGNVDEFTDQERIIQTQFTFTVPTALMLDPVGDRPAVQLERTAFTFSRLEESVHIVDDRSKLDDIFSNKVCPRCKRPYGLCTCNKK